MIVYKEARLDDLKVGKTYVYKNKRKSGDYSEISNTIHPLALYDATIIGIYPHHITLSLTVRQETIHNDLIISAPTPYNWSIEKVEYGRFDHLYEEVEEDGYAE